MNPFYDRIEAGRELAKHLVHYAGRPRTIVLGLPRGGVEVAYEVARALGLPLDVFVVRKLGVPGHEELAMGAIASGAVRVLNEHLVKYLQIPDQIIQEVTATERRELERREKLYRGKRPPLDVCGTTVILVDDGLATGSTARAAIAALRAQEPFHIVMTAAVAAPETCEEISQVVDEVVCARTPEPFIAVGLWYEHFPQLSDDEVRELLEASEREIKEEKAGRE